MSNLIYPALPGRAWPITRTAIYKTDPHESASGRELRIARWAYARYSYKLKYAFLREWGTFTELQAVAGLFGACKGSFDTFLWQDPDPAFSVATAQQFGVGDGVTTKFQLARSYASQFAEPVAAVQAGAQVFVAGSLSGSASVDVSTAAVTFASPPAAGAALTWSGTYYWRCRFTKDELQAEQFMHALWSGDVEFITVKV